jgi:hypothetical protein
LYLSNTKTVIFNSLALHFEVGDQKSPAKPLQDLMVLKENAANCRRPVKAYQQLGLVAVVVSVKELAQCDCPDLSDTNFGLISLINWLLFWLPERSASVKKQAGINGVLPALHAGPFQRLR